MVKNVLGTFLKKIITRGGAITSVKVEEREVKTTDEILKGVESFYQELYSPKEVHDDTVKEVLNFIVKKVNSKNELLIQDFTFL